MNVVADAPLADATDSAGTLATGASPRTTLNVDVNGQGNVAVNPIQTDYAYGQMVTLTAVPDPGWSFDHWESETTPALPWWDDGWDYRVLIDVDAQGTARTDQAVEVALNFTDLLAGLGVSGQFDDGSIRLVEVDVDGNVINDQIPAQFDRDGGYDPATQASGRVIFFIAGQTTSNQIRHFHLYFGLNDRSYPAPSFTAPVKLTANGVVDEGLDAFKIETLRGTYYYQKLAGGFSSLVDVDGNDWISHHPTPGSGSAGEYRGIPNAVHPNDGGHLHPGNTTATSSIVDQGPVRVMIKTLVRDPVTQDVLWDARWTLYPTHATMRLLKNATNYWFLYEGTPGGALETNTDFVVRADGTQTSAATAWSGDLEPEEWVYFADPNVGGGRSLFLVQHGNNNIVDSYRPMNGEMTVFGFGRDGSHRYFTDTPSTFSIGLMDETAYAGASTVIAGVTQPLGVSVGEPETRYPMTETLPASNPLALTMDYNRHVTAVFTQDAYSLAVGIDGDGTGTVTRDPDATVYPFDAQVTLTAQPDPGSRFNGWSGAASGDAISTTVTIQNDTVVTATFDLEHYPLQVEKVGEGTVTRDPDQATYTYGQQVKLTATPAAEHAFVRWTGDLTSDQPMVTAVITGNMSVEAVFSPLYTVTLTSTPLQSGIVTVTPQKDRYLAGESVTLEAIPAAGWAFTGWSGDLTGDDNPTTLTMDTNKQIVARFARLHTLTVGQEGGGTVTQTPPPPAEGYVEGRQVTLEAIPDAGWHFAGWSGDLSGADNPAIVTVNDDMSVTARFVRRAYLPLVANP